LAATLVGHEEPITHLLEIENGDLLTMAYDGSLKIWDIKTGEITKSIDAHEYSISCVELLTHGNLAIADTFGSINIWNVNSGTKVKRISDAHISGCDISSLACF
jgi:WD40 repeat protein